MPMTTTTASTRTVSDGPPVRLRSARSMGAA
jgi:hypothetical protein